MALATSVTGDGILVSQQKGQRLYTVEQNSMLYTFRDIITETVREWVALTEGAATDAVAAITPASGETGTADEDNRVIGSYKFTKSTETKTTVLVSAVPLPDEE